MNRKLGELKDDTSHFKEYICALGIYTKNNIHFFMMMKEEVEDNVVITAEEIDRCIAVLAQLNNDTDQIFDIPKLRW